MIAAILSISTQQLLYKSQQLQALGCSTELFNNPLSLLSSDDIYLINWEKLFKNLLQVLKI